MRRASIAAAGLVAASIMAGGNAVADAADAAESPQVLMTPRSTAPYLEQIANGERVREQRVVESAARATLERAKREAAAAVAGEYQPWIGGSGSAGGDVSALGIGGYVLPAQGTFTSGFGRAGERFIRASTSRARSAPRSMRSRTAP